MRNWLSEFDKCFQALLGTDPFQNSSGEVTMEIEEQVPRAQGLLIAKRFQI